MSSRSVIRWPRATTADASASRSTADSPRNGPSKAAVRKSSIISIAVARLSGAGRNTTSCAASAKMPPTPSITVGPNCGSRTAPAISSRMPETIGATSRSTSPSSGRAAASRACEVSRAAVSSGTPRWTRPRSDLWAMPSPFSLSTTGKPSAEAAVTAASASAAERSGASGRPNAASSSLDARSDSVVVRRCPARDDTGVKVAGGRLLPSGSAVDQPRSATSTRRSSSGL